MSSQPNSSLIAANSEWLDSLESSVSSPSTFLDRASSMVELGVPVVPLPPCKKFPPPKSWQDFATTNIETINGWLVPNGQPAIAFKDSNCACVATLDGVWFLDIDNMQIVSAQIEKETGHKLQEIQTLVVRSSDEKRHLYFKQNDVSRALGNVDYDSAEGAELFSARVNGKYVVSPLSVHPDTGAEYEVTRNMDIIEAPVWLTDWLKTAKRSSGQRKAKQAADETVKVSEGGRDDFLFAKACELRDAKMSQKAALAALLVINADQCVPPMDESVVRIKIKSAYTRDARKQKNAEGHVESSTSPTPKPCVDGQDDVQILDGAFHGILGRIIRKLQPQTESHPMGNLLELMTSVGSMIGRTAYAQVEGTKHFCNLFFVRVGVTARSRKGTGKDRVAEIMNLVNPTWMQYQNTSGLGSGEAVIWAIRDRLVGPVQDKKTHQWSTEVIDPGEENKTLHVSEGEFVGVLTVASRKDNILSKIIRDGWDGKPLRNTVKTAPCFCLEPHLSMACDITKNELLRGLSESDKFNGFANRYLWPHVSRMKELPHGGEPIDWTEEARELQNAIEFAREQQRVFMHRNARLRWERMYHDLGVDELGIVGAVTARAEAQVLRLSLIFALLDLSDQIKVEHLEAANAVWQYCLASARFIFGQTVARPDSLTSDQVKLLGFLSGGPKNRTQISVDCFQRHKSADGITLDLAVLKNHGHISETPDTKGTAIFSVKG